MMAWLWGAGIVALAAVLYWHIVVTEGAYLGQGIVTLLYDRFAHKYNRVKEFDPQEEHLFVAAPLVQVLGADFEGMLVDVATGTGRLPRALLAHPGFHGVVVGIDRSTRMLAEARDMLPNVPLVVASAMRLPFADGSAGAATCIEALEFFPRPVTGLHELARILHPNGVLLATNRIGWETKLMPGKTFSAAKLTRLLTDFGFDAVKIRPWLDIYNQVWARKMSPRH